MSTRANVLIDDGCDRLWFYRHSDGYPEGTLSSLIEFMQAVSTSKIRNNTSQGAGWLIVIGHKEYESKAYNENWKVGSYEPTTGIHGDINYLYSLDLKECKILVSKVQSVNDAGIPTVRLIDEITFASDGSYTKTTP